MKAFEDSSRMFYVEKIYPLVRIFFQANATLGLLHQTFPLEFNVKKNRTTSISKSMKYSLVPVSVFTKSLEWKGDA